MLGKKILIFKPSFTLIELLVVVVIVGIVATFAMPGFFGAQKKTIDKEARTNLKLIQTAEEIKEVEEGQYKPCGSNSACNTALSLDLPASVANGGNWDYSVTCSSSCSSGFTAQATGSKGTQNWSIDEDAQDAQ
ncbi:MAG: prepilin-type N-terminal cleavage/methylation domain-containing protein [Candidatus Omnitrophica bacterium]|nr:prepilin-type N-terminal cleavage/methylation domain-containing protein [Candidatus Omnitrophota bacterium]MCF7894427.1 prepilin-type N-terminal cleavage/methylation domain-containing protein [Candidatus Omnitrophota bacterium]